MFKTKIDFNVTKFLRKVSDGAAASISFFKVDDFNVTKFLKQVSAGAVVSIAPLSAYAQVAPAAPTTLAALTAGISFADVSLGILAVAGSLITVYILYKGVKMIITAVRGA